MLREIIKSYWALFARWCCWLFYIVFFHVRFYGLQNVPAKGPFILAVNHQSFLDPMLAGIALRGQICFVARDTLLKNKIFGPLLSSVKTIPVRRGKPDISSIKMIISRLKKGEGICLFPEATRSTDGKIAPFKGGFSLLCRRGNSPVVPVLIDGAFECWPRHRKLFIPGSTITVTYGKPISAEHVMEMEDDDFVKLLTDTLRKMQSQVRLAKGKQPYSYS